MPDVKRGRYMAEFLAHSVICDEVGVLLEDGPGWCLGDFSRSQQRRRSAAPRLPGWKRSFRCLRRSMRSIPSRAGRASCAPSRRRRRSPGKLDDNLPPRLWPELSSRERAAGRADPCRLPDGAASPSALAITVGTVKNHRRRIYEKLDITTERELFLQYFMGSGEG